MIAFTLYLGEPEADAEVRPAAAEAGAVLADGAAEPTYPSQRSNQRSSKSITRARSFTGSLSSSW